MLLPRLESELVGKYGLYINLWIGGRRSSSTLFLVDSGVLNTKCLSEDFAAEESPLVSSYSLSSLKFESKFREVFKPPLFREGSKFDWEIWLCNNSKSWGIFVVCFFVFTILVDFFSVLVILVVFFRVLVNLVILVIFVDSLIVLVMWVDFFEDFMYFLLFLGLFLGSDFGIGWDGGSASSGFSFFQESIFNLTWYLDW